MANHYWRSLDERGDPLRIAAATPESDGSAPASRRDFLKLAGFSATGAFAASCSRAPARRAMPYVSQPNGITPGRAVWYATTCGACPAGCGLLVKARDGRPLKIEGCPEHPVSRGGTCAVGQGALLGLYDNLRFRAPLIEGAATGWAEVDAEMRKRLETIRQGGGAVRILTGTVHSPTVLRAIEQFAAAVPGAEHVQYDAISASAILDAHEITHGIRALPRLRFDQADVVVSLDADFLGTWISPSEFTSAYAARRRSAGGPVPWHAQVESRVSITGGKADRRVALAPDEIDALAFDLLDRISARAAGEGVAAAFADRLLAARGRSLVVSGSQDARVQVAVNRINEALGNYGPMLDLDRPSLQRRGDDKAVARLLQDVRDGRVGAVFVWRANPVFDLPGGDVLEKVPLLVSFAERADDTSRRARFVCPDHHPLESWGDSEPVSGTLGLTQPLVRPLGRTRAFVESLAAWSGQPKSARELVRDTWRERVFPRQTTEPEFERFWSASVQRGHVQLADGAIDPRPARRTAPAGARSGTGATPTETVRPESDPDALHLVLYHTVALLSGEHAYNPMLQELPDPVTKIVWDNYASIAPSFAAAHQISTGDVVRIQVGGMATQLPALVQPGQHERTIAVALGYGSVMTERFKDLGHHWFRSRPTVGINGRVGVTAAPFIRFDGETFRTDIPGVIVTRTSETQDLACTQSHHSLAVPARLAPAGAETRPIVQETSAVEPQGPESQGEGEPADLWQPDHPATGHRWGMAVDLDACTGCSSCVIACQIENNTPVVGKDEVRRTREMHWLRLDRYYSEDEAGLHIASQPMLCQHCEHAPCETVCPTLATVHSEEGLNQQIYNRCVGTRYCLNNCPYKARRFNWFEYAREEGTGHLMLNPDVTVRSRGIMEKCTFCVQRIQEARIESVRTGVPIKDGDIATACEQSCPARAIVFGDLNDPASRVSKAARSARGYKVLEELNVRPSVTYLKVVRREAAGSGSKEHA